MSPRPALTLAFSFLAAFASGCGSTSGADAGPTADSGTSPDSGSSVVFNKCTDGKFSDHTTEAIATVAFGDSLGLAYSPPCILIAAGKQVTFKGDFSTHPLAPGTTTSATAGSPGNPITAVSSGQSTTVTFPTAGEYPYFCVNHGSVGMAGVVRVR